MLNPLTILIKDLITRVEFIMELEDLITNMISKTGKTRDEISRLIEKKQSDAGGAISDKAAATLVSKDLGINFILKSPSQVSKIQDLHHMAPGSSNIIISGVIKRVYYRHQFQQEQKTKYVQNIDLKDETGNIKLVLWGNMVTLAHKLQLKKGDFIRILKSILKNGRMGERELHLGDNATIEKNPEVLKSKELDEIDIWSDVLLPGAITKHHSKDKEIDVQGIVVKKQPIMPGKPLNFFLIDPAPSENNILIRVVVWGDRSEDFYDIQDGQEILLEGIRIKIGLQTKPEINVNRRSNLTILEKKPIDVSKFLKIEEDKLPVGVTPNLLLLKTHRYLNLNLRILWIGKLSKFSRKDGTNGHVIRLGVYDTSGCNNLVLWDEDATRASNFPVGNIIAVTELYYKENRNKTLELSLGRNGSITLSSDKNSNLIPKTLPPIPINEISDSWKMVSLFGEITEVSENKTFQRNDGSEGQLRSLKLLDNSGEIRIVAWDNDVKLLDDIHRGQLIGLEGLSVKKGTNEEINVYLNSYTKIMLNLNEKIIPEWANNIEIRTPQYQNKYKDYSRILLNNLTNNWQEELVIQIEGDEKGKNWPRIEFRAIIINIDDRRIYYDGCPHCGRKVELITEKEGTCSVHDQIKPIPKLLLRVTFDDGTKLLIGSILGSVAEKITGMKPYHVQQFLESHNFDHLELLNELKKRIIGHEYIILGRLGVRKASNETDQIYWDLKIDSITQPDPIVELQVLETQKSGIKLD
ncbi:MAG: hypothetical protein ACXAC7_12210 [Candidatus Hodarchaeales archaeon]|jgi:ssDNA-binding replication factor A large subunit